MSEIFDEGNMRRVLGRAYPGGGSSGGRYPWDIPGNPYKGIFGKCTYMEDKLVPDEKGRVIVVQKEKHCDYDVYIGITRHFLVIAGCEKNSYFYMFDDAPEGSEGIMQEILSETFLADIGTCFPLADIQDCQFKKGGWDL